MNNMNKEVHYEGWLIKSPPSKRIWRSRWRRRWFTLKQGEIPEQFCLEYYTDRNCRKLKGIIDLDQCEQVDCGLRLENRKQKFQFMFDIKTPKRTYYLAADTVDDMRDWVNCICQVCHLHDIKHSMEEHEKPTSVMQGAFVIGEFDQMLTCGNINSHSTPVSNITQSVVNIHNNQINSHRQLFLVSSTSTANPDNIYQNNQTAYVNTKYCSTDLLNDLTSDSTHSKNNDCENLTVGNPDAKTYFNMSARSNKNILDHEHGALRKLPENLTLQSSPLLEVYSFGIQSSPSLSSSTGPYIPISECFSGTPKHLENPTTPLNNLDPKFYDTPRSHNNIGLNLTSDQSYSPKITNCTSRMQIMDTKSYTTVSGRSDSDSEGVFTDDDEWTYPMPIRESIDRTARPSDSSVENESFVLTYSQRFSKMPDEFPEKPNNNKSNIDKDYKSKKKPYELGSKFKKNLSLDIKQNQKISQVPQLSDTENTSPAIGPHDACSIVEGSYDIPRSHQLPYHNLVEMFKDQIRNNESVVSSKSLNEISACLKTGTDETLHKHCYTNAAPNKLEGDVFRYDFIEQADLPPVNRKLKPKTATSCEIIDELADRVLNNPITEDKPPSVDRKLKPNIYKVENTSGKVFRSSIDVTNSVTIPSESDKNILQTQTLLRSSFNTSSKSNPQMVFGSTDNTVLHGRSVSVNHASAKLNPLSTHVADEPRLQYFDLDLTNPPTVNRQMISISNLSKLESKKIDLLARNSLKSGVVYNSVDFVKTEAFKRIREEREKESENVNSDTKISK